MNKHNLLVAFFESISPIDFRIEFAMSAVAEPDVMEASSVADEVLPVVVHPRWEGRMFGQWKMHGPKGLWKPHWPMPQPRPPLQDTSGNVPPPPGPAKPALYKEVKPHMKSVRSALGRRGLATDGDRAAMEKRLVAAVCAEGNPEPTEGAERNSAANASNALETRGLATDGDRETMEKRLVVAVCAEGDVAGLRVARMAKGDTADPAASASTGARPLSPDQEHTGYTPAKKRQSRASAGGDADGVEDLQAKFAALESPLPRRSD